MHTLCTRHARDMQLASSAGARVNRSRLAAEVGGAEAGGGGPVLVPVGVDDRRGADRVEAGALVGAELQVRAGKAVPELLLVAAADDERGDAGAAEEPGEGDLGAGDAAGGGHGLQGVDDAPEAGDVADRRLAPAGGLARRGGVGAVLA